MKFSYSKKISFDELGYDFEQSELQPVIHLEEYRLCPNCNDQMGWDSYLQEYQCPDPECMECPHGCESYMEKDDRGRLKCPNCKEGLV